MKNLKLVRVSTARAGLTCDPDLDVTTDGPVTVVLGGCDRAVDFG